MTKGKENKLRQSLKLQKMLFGMSVPCQSVDTWY